MFGEIFTGRSEDAKRGYLDSYPFAIVTEPPLRRVQIPLQKQKKPGVHLANGIQIDTRAVVFMRDTGKQTVQFGTRGRNRIAHLTSERDRRQS